MSMIDLEQLLAPISDDAPCGPELRSEPDFREIEDAPAEFGGMKPPELLKLVRRCAEMLGRSKDQMPAIVGIQAALRAGDIATATTLVSFIARTADDHWDAYHPGPAEEMAIGRLNELSALARPPAMVLPLQRMGMAAMPAPSGTEFTSSMLELALQPVKEWASEDDDKLNAQIQSGAVNATAAKGVKPNREGARQLRLILLSLSETERAADSAAETLPSGFDAMAALPLAMGLREQIVARQLAAQALSDHLYTINDVFDRRMGDSPSLGPVLAQLKSMIGNAEAILELFPDPANMTAEEAAAPEAAASGGAAVAGAAAAAPKRFSGDTPQSRADVVIAIDAIMKYYTTSEPTSPVPLMLRRVRNWVEMDFFRLLKEIAPNAADDAQRLLAIRDE
jgi:type VI secretion system protein ImpA